MKKKYLVSCIISIVSVALAFGIWELKLNKQDSLPIFNAEFFPAYLRADQGYEKQHFIQPFSFKNQLNQNVNAAIFDDKVTVVSFFYANCTLVCPTIIRKLKTVQSAILDKSDVQILSITITPTIDTPEVLNMYAKENNIQPDKWQLLTGNMNDIIEFARNSFFVLTSDKNRWNQNIHSETLFLVDLNKQIRGVYNATQRKDIENLLADIYSLSKK